MSVLRMLCWSLTQNSVIVLPHTHRVLTRDVPIANLYTVISIYDTTPSKKRFCEVDEYKSETVGYKKIAHYTTGCSFDVHRHLDHALLTVSTQWIIFVYWIAPTD